MVWQESWASGYFNGGVTALVQSSSEASHVNDTCQLQATSDNLVYAQARRAFARGGPVDPLRPRISGSPGPGVQLGADASTLPISLDTRSVKTNS